MRGPENEKGDAMNASGEFLSPSEAARRLGVSSKALRLYEQRGLIAPIRSEAGWRAYGPVEMERAGEIVALRRLGLSVSQVGRVLHADPQALASALALHQASLEGRIHALGIMARKVREWRDGLARGRMPTAGEMAQLLAPGSGGHVAFDLPWPWGGERFELREIRALTYITGPLGSGKTRLARCLGDALPDAGFVGLDRAAAARQRLDADRGLAARVARAQSDLAEEGGTGSQALTALLAVLEAEEPTILVVDLIEQGLDKATQEALTARLRRRGPGARPLFVLTRSTAILDLDSVGDHEAILYCPANHGVPIRVAPHPGMPGYEAVASCLASPEVRARSEGVVAWRPGMPVPG